MSELRIYFADLLAFVAAADGFHVLLPDARLPSTATDGSIIDPHYPVVLFDLPNQGASEWQQIHQLLKLTDPIGNHEAWLLDRQELTIAGAPALPVQASGAAASGLPNVNNKNNFTWVPDLATLGVNSRVDPGCLLPAGVSATGLRPSSKIVSRLHIERGALTTFQFVKRSLTTFPFSLRLPALEFKALGGSTVVGPTRACADVVLANIPFSGSSVTLAAVDLDTGSTIRSITLTTSPSGLVNVFVGNLSPEVPAGPVPLAGAHFERYYDLLASPAPSRFVPHIVSGFPGPGTHVSPTGINGNLPTFIRSALQVPFSGFNGPICPQATLQG